MGNTNRVDSSVSPAPHLKKEAVIPEFPAANKLKQPEIVEFSEKRKRGRPRKSPVETIQNVTGYLNKNDDDPCIIPAPLAVDMETSPLPNRVKTLNKDIEFSGGSDIKDRKRTPTKKREGNAVEESINPQDNHKYKKGRKHRTYLRVQEPSPVSAVEQPMENGEKNQGVISVLEEVSEKRHESEVSIPAMNKHPVALMGPQGLPFVKNNILWKTLEAMDPFQRIPQNPHFQPLQHIEENLREGKAIGYMVAFAGTVEKIYGLQFGDPKSVTDSILETLAELEKHGFNVKPMKDRVSELLVVKEKGTILVGDLKEINGRILEHCQKKDKVEEEIEGVKREIKKMEQRLSVLESTKEKEEGETAAAVHLLKKTEEHIVDVKRQFEADWFPSSRTVDELKDQYYGVSRALVIGRAPSSGDVAGHPLVKDQYKVWQETGRERALSLLLPHTKQQERKDVEVPAHAKVITEARKTLKAAAEARLPPLPDNGPLSADKTADIVDLTTNSQFAPSTTPVSEIASLRVYLRTYALEQMVQAASSSARHRTMKRVEQTLQDLGVNLKPMVPTKAVCAEHLELRKEILTLSSLQKQLQYKEAEGSSFRDGSFTETPGTSHKQQQSLRAAELDRTFTPESISIGGERFGKREQKFKGPALSSPAQLKKPQKFKALD